MRYYYFKRCEINLKLKTFVCPMCKKPLILRYQYLIVQRTPQKETFVPTFICNHHGGVHHLHYKIINNKITPFE
jgi:RNase P subunit RPR2